MTFLQKSKSTWFLKLCMCCYMWDPMSNIIILWYCSDTIHLRGIVYA